MILENTKKSEIIYARLQNENNQDENNIKAMLLQGLSQSMILDSTHKFGWAVKENQGLGTKEK